MKILYLYHKYFARRKEYGEIMSRLGHDVSYLRIDKKNNPNFKLEIEVIENKKPDLLWILSPFYISNGLITEDVIEFVRNKNIPIVLYGCFDVKVPYLEWVDTIWKKMDFLFMDSLVCATDLKKCGLPAYYVPLGFYPEQYFHRTRTQKTYDVSFMGSEFKRSKRSLYLDAICNRFPSKNIGIFGEAFVGKITVDHTVYPYSTHQEQRKVYSKSIINLDLPFVAPLHPFYEKILTIKNRFFEIPATGNFMMTAKCDEFLEFFTKKDVAYYEDNIESLLDTIKFWLRPKRLEQRRCMAMRAYEKVHNHHTYEHRFQKMFGIIKKVTGKK